MIIPIDCFDLVIKFNYTNNRTKLKQKNVSVKWVLICPVMTVFEKISIFIKKIVKCDFHNIERTGSFNEVIVTDATIQANDRETVNNIPSAYRNSGNNILGPSRTHLNNNRVSSYRNNAFVNDLLYLENDDERQGSSAEVPPYSGRRPMPSPRHNKQQNAETEKLSKKFKEYIQRQLEELTENTLSYKGTKNSDEYTRLQKRISRELEALEEMDINDKVSESKWKTQVNHLRKMLSFNAKRRQEQADVEAERNQIIKLAKAKTENIPSIHKQIVKHDVKIAAAVQNQESQESYARLKCDLDNINTRLIAFSVLVFNFCSHQKNQDYDILESNINNELDILRRTTTRHYPELTPRKLEIEQFGRTWLNELQRRLNEMQIRKYEGRIKVLW